jgi:CHAT domain-containing protein
MYDSSAYCSLIWQPMEKYLTGVSKVYFSPAGLLHRVSFAALPVDDEHVLGDKYQLVQMNSTAAVMDEQKTRLLPSDKMVLYGGIRYNAPGDKPDAKAFGYLSGTLNEIDRISSIVRPEGVRTDLITGDSATEGSIRSLEHGDATVLHLATHGFYFPEKIKEKTDSSPDHTGKSAAEMLSNADDPLLRSGVLFAGGNYAWLGKSRDSAEDGILTAYEVANLYMPAIKLAVLSACETASGDVYGDEGVYGLQRSFKMAGVTYLVMSLWPVPGPQTTDFMLAFYSNMVHGLTISDAFYSAQREMRSIYRYTPHRWAAWVLIR